MAVLEPKYANHQIWHYQGGNTQVLEEELIYTNPAHDDVKDALASAIDYVVTPLNLFNPIKQKDTPMEYHARFGGAL